MPYMLSIRSVIILLLKQPSGESQWHSYQRNHTAESFCVFSRLTCRGGCEFEFWEVSAGYSRKFGLLFELFGFVGIYTKKSCFYSLFFEREGSLISPPTKSMLLILCMYTIFRGTEQWGESSRRRELTSFLDCKKARKRSFEKTEKLSET